MSLRSTSVTAATTDCAGLEHLLVGLLDRSAGGDDVVDEQHPAARTEGCALDEAVRATALGLLAHHEPAVVVGQRGDDPVGELVRPQRQAADRVPLDARGSDRGGDDLAGEAEVRAAGKAGLGVDEVPAQFARGELSWFVELDQRRGADHVEQACTVGVRQRTWSRA